jgi:glycosyltransferase involved in cell wall biosynthesis
MHILFLTQIIPYPPDAGPKVKTWHVLRYLVGQGHQLTLASFVRPEEEKFVPVLQELCQSVYTIPIKRSGLADLRYWLRSHFSGRPFLIERDDLAGMHTIVKRIVETEKVDAIHADQLSMTIYGLPYSSHEIQAEDSAGLARPALIFDAHNAVWTIVKRMQENTRWYLKPILSLEARRVKRYEGRVVREFDYTLAVTEPDRLALQEAVKSAGNGRDNCEPHYCVVPIAVDTHQLQPVSRQTDSLNIMTMGTLHYPPNADGVRWFAKDVFPLVRQRVPQATLTIVGKNPPPDFLQLQEQHPGEITVTGYVPDLTPYMEKAAIMVVAVRAGGGMRVRILEAFARGMPVVTTTVGLEGIDARPGEEVLVADSPADFADAVTRLLRDQDLQAELGVKGRYLAEQRYDWQVVLGKMEEIYLEIASGTSNVVGSNDKDA